MKETINWNANTHVGRFRKNNEDAFLALQISPEGVHRLGKTGEAKLEGCSYLFAVADGMGGAKAGEFASDLAREAIIQELPAAFDARSYTQENAVALLRNVFVKTHNRLIWLGLNYEECRGMGATLSLVWITPLFVVLAHIGDSRIYRLTADGTFDQLTVDHTHAGWLQKKGELNEREFRQHPMRHALQQALGGDARTIKPQVETADFASGDQLLLCSDGVVEGLWNNGIKRLLSQQREDRVTVADKLIREAVQTSGRDNTTAVVVARS